MSEKISSSENLDLIDQLRRFREDWSDKIPQEIIHSVAPDNKYKVRTNWFAGVVLNAWCLLEEGKLTDESAKKAAQELVNRFTTEDFKNRKLHTAEDIQTANNLIDGILKSF